MPKEKTAGRYWVYVVSGICWLAMFTVLILLLGNIKLFNLIRINSDHHLAYGNILEKRCNYHLNVSYEFMDSGNTYTGQDIRDDCNLLKKGDSVLVNYYGYNPSINTLHEPMDSQNNELLTVGLLAMILPSFFMFGVIRKMK